MLAIERQNIIRNILLEKKSVSVSDLAARFDVSLETVRRDLRALELAGVAEKSYGGAVLKEKVSHKENFETLSRIMVDAKRKMAAKALQFIVPGDSIYIDFSTTCGAMVDLLGEAPINVLTNSLEVIERLTGKANISLLSTGGSWDPDNRAFMGRTAVQNLSQFHLDKAFISCRALSMDQGISDRTETESELRKKIIESSNEVYLLADYSKFDKIAFVRTCDFKHITAVITDMILKDEWKTFFDNSGVHYYDGNSIGKSRSEELEELDQVESRQEQ